MAILDRASGANRKMHSGQFVLFVVEQRKFAVDVNHVREIRSWQPVTEMPNPRPFLLGVINLRGSIIPIMDLHARLGVLRRENRSDGVVIVVERHGQSAGFLADSVSDIVTASAEQFHDPSEVVEVESAALQSILIIEPDIIGVLDLAAFISPVQPAAAA